MKNLKVAKIQQKLKDKKIDSLIINRTDEFLNEYISPDAERLFWVTDFSGSAGRVIISQNKSNLFVDGRYTFQAKEQIDDSVISLLHFNDFSKELSKHFSKNKCIALDPMLHSIEEVNKIIELAKGAKIYDVIEFWLEGYNTVVGERGVKISGGELQRIGLARALYKDPEILILDEATSALDRSTENKVMQYIYDLKDTMTVFIVAHRESTLDECSLKIELSNGNLK